MHVTLRFESGRSAGQSYLLRPGQTFVLGRGRDVSIRIEDEKVSRRHTTIGLQPDGTIEVADLGSRNGTVLDGRSLAANVRVRARSGSVVEIGDARVRLALEGEEARRVDQIADLPDIEILAEVGRGATGRVFVGRHRLVGRSCAVKALKPQYVPGSRERERFLREGKLAAKVKSPFVVEVYDVKSVEDRCYIIMELVQGPSAKDRVAQGALPLREALKIGEDVALALAAANEVGVVHRDVKPGNVLIGSDGNAKLTDFGIAKDLDSATLSPLTATGDGIGTLAYVSPEQAENAKKVDHRTDLYGLGATLYHLLAGRPPFLPTSARVLLDILDKPPPPIQSFRPEVPDGVATIVHRLIEKDPAKRYSTARELAFLLREARASLPAGAPQKDGTHWSDANMDASSSDELQGDEPGASA